MFRRILLAIIVLPLLCACSSGGVKGEVPFVQVTAWKLQGETLQATLRLRNVNEEALKLRSLSLSVDVNQQVLAQYQGNHAVTVPANGFESINLSMVASQPGLALLLELENGQRSSLPYVLTGTIEAEGLGALVFNRDGHLYPVPGRPGQFR